MPYQLFRGLVKHCEDDRLVRYQVGWRVSVCKYVLVLLIKSRQWFT